MTLRLRPVSQQTIVITGASSGIGLVTARMAARRGARLVLAARNESALCELCREIEEAGGEAEMVVADVGRQADVARIAERASARFGGFDTWINNAGCGVYGTMREVAMEDHRRLFQTNFWGTVHGSLVAVEHLKVRGGALINIGSQLSDHGMPLLGMYTASKHAVKGFTDSLRMELELERVPVSVTLIKPTSIDSSFVAHARNQMGVEAALPPPLYDPQVVARAILAAAERPVRDVFVGAPAKLASLAARAMPRLFHELTRAFAYRLVQGRRSLPEGTPADNLYRPSEDLQERGSARGRPVLARSVYTRVATALGDRAGAAVLLLCGAAAVALLSARRARANL